MTTPADNVVPLTGNALIDGLTWGAAWQFGGGAHTLTYSLSLNDDYATHGGTWTTALANGARLALSEWSQVANITFVENDSGTNYRASNADIALILTGSDLQSSMSGVVGLGIPPSPSYADSMLPALGETRDTYPHLEGDVALDNYYYGFNYLNWGGIGLTIMLHEIGHALGLKHTNNGPDGRPDLPVAYDSNLYTVMSYNDVWGPDYRLGSDVLGNAATPMPLDILAMQQIYGANTSYHTGNDTYTFWGPSPSMAWTIWDAGGNDTLVAGAVNQYNDVTLDLREGHYSQSPTIINVTMAIAYGAVIENAIGGDGNDTLIGNAANNRLDGGLGNDTMSGGIGNDIYVVDSGGDVVIENAGEGNDTVLTAASYALPANVDNLTLTGSASISGQGNELGNVLTGNSGSSTLYGGAGDDALMEGAGTASMHGGTGNDNYYVNNSIVISGTGWSYTGQAGDYVSQGQTVSLQANTPQWTVLMHDQTHDGLIDNLTMWGNDISGNHSFSFSVTTDQIGQNLLPGSYADVMRANVGIAGHAGLDFGTDGRGSNQVFGSFVINDIGIDYSGSTPHLIRFSATFEQHSESPTAPALTGKITYGEPDTTVTSTIVELPGEGNDQVFSSVWCTLAPNVEDLTLTGSGAIGGFGNGFDNALFGNVADNILNSQAGNDTLMGGAGNDHIDGGVGFDAAQFAGNKVDYTVTKSAGYGYTITDANPADGNDGTDTLFAVEKLQFADGSTGLASRILERAGTPSIWSVIDNQHDFNSDGKGDLWWKQAGGTGAIWVMDGTNTPAPHVIGPNTGWSVVDATSDYNGDGKPDLSWHNTDGSTMQWLNAVDLATVQGIGPDAGWPLS